MGSFNLALPGAVGTFEVLVPEIDSLKSRQPSVATTSSTFFGCSILSFAITDFALLRFTLLNNLGGVTGMKVADSDTTTSDG